MVENLLNKKIIISVDANSADLFKEFSNANPKEMKLVKHKSFLGQVDMVDFIVELSTTLVEALTSYLIIRKQTSKKKIIIKKNGVEIELDNTDMTPEDTIDLLKKLEKN